MHQTPEENFWKWSFQSVKHQMLSIHTTTENLKMQKSLVISGYV